MNAAEKKRMESVPEGWRSLQLSSDEGRERWTRWQLTYTDGRTFDSNDGAWAEAPQSYVNLMEIWYDRHYDWIVSATDYPIAIPTRHAPFYLFIPEMGYPVHAWEWMTRVRKLRCVKFGEWIGFTQYTTLCQRMIDQPKPYPTWSLMYADGLLVTSQDTLWEDAPLDGVILARQDDGQLIRGNDYYFWQDGQLKTSHSIEEMLREISEIKIGTTSYVNWPPVSNPQIMEGRGT